MSNPYVPMPMEIDKVVAETAAADLRSFYLNFLNPEDEQRFQYLPGQFAELSLLGKGESPIGIASAPGEQLRFTVMRVGTVTTELHAMDHGDRIGLRGPLGHPWPMEFLEGKNVVVIGGGFAFTTLRSFTSYALSGGRRDRFGDLTVIYGARSPGALLYKDELAEWAKRDDLTLAVTVDKGDDTWTGREGFVPTVTEQVAPSSDNAVALVCGPPIMIKFTLPVLTKLGFPPERTLTSLEMRMKCGIGKCGRCNVGHKYVCLDGPVFSLAELNELPGEY